MKIQSNIIRDKIELCDHTGEVVREIPFTVNVAKIARDVTAKRKELSELPQDDVERIGYAAVELMRIIFGEEATAQLLEHYENDYFTMVTDITPLLTERIYPAFTQYGQSMMTRMKGLKRRA